MLGVNVRAGIAQRFDPYLVELTEASLLRAFVTEHRPCIIKSLRPRIKQIVLQHGTHAGCRAFRAQGQALSIQLVGKGVHFLLDDVCRLPNRTHEKIGLLQNGRADIEVAVTLQPGAHGIFNVFPQVRLTRQDIAHAANRLDVFVFHYINGK